VSEFVNECRREWARLGVPDPVANEMAADLTADLDEAEAEGGSPEDVLGNSAFDPRRFAAAWAVARGVTGPVAPDRPSPRWRPFAIALAVLLGVVVVVAGLAVLGGHTGRSIAIVSGGRGPIRLAPGPGGFVFPGPLAYGIGPQIAGVGARLFALALLAVALAGLAGLLVFLYRSPWSVRRRARRHGGTPPNWN
jgi:hypothetical protein